MLLTKDVVLIIDILLSNGAYKRVLSVDIQNLSSKIPYSAKIINRITNERRLDKYNQAYICL